MLLITLFLQDQGKSEEPFPPIYFVHLIILSRIFGPATGNCERLVQTTTVRRVDIRSYHRLQIFPSRERAACPTHTPPKHTHVHARMHSYVHMHRRANN